jgi:hypothetical protein
MSTCEISSHEISAALRSNPSGAYGKSRAAIATTYTVACYENMEH